MMYNITHDSYKLIEREKDSFYTIELLEDPHKGVKYQYGNVRLRLENEGEADEYARLMFTWTLIDGDESLSEDEDFNNYIGEVLGYVIQDAFDTGNYNIGNNNDNTDSSNNDTQESA